VPETYLSVNWLELLSGANRVAQIDALRAAFAGKGFKVGSTARFAVHQIGELCEYVRSQSPDRRQLNVLHDPEPDDESHAALHGLQLDDELIAEFIARVVQESFPAKAWRRATGSLHIKLRGQAHTPERMQHGPSPGGPNCRCSQYGAARFSFTAENGRKSITRACRQTGVTPAENADTHNT
jgi:hypothetical protein